MNKLSLKYNIIIFSNQKGVSIGKTTNIEVQKLIDDFCTKINIPISIFYSTTDDENRKPMIGMFNFAKKIFEKTSSFLIKLLQIDWRWGEKYFAKTLIDYDPSVNNGNW